MAPHYLSGLLILSALFLLEASCRPSNNELFRGGQRRSFQGDYKRYHNEGYSWKSDVYQHNRGRFVKDGVKGKHSKFSLHVKPRAFALSSGGVAIANPVSNVVISQNEEGSIVHAPVAAAVVGPGGIAHAQSDLYLYEYVYY